MTKFLTMEDGRLINPGVIESVYNDTVTFKNGRVVKLALRDYLSFLFGHDRKMETKGYNVLLFDHSGVVSKGVKTTPLSDMVYHDATDSLNLNYGFVLPMSDFNIYPTTVSIALQCPCGYVMDVNKTWPNADAWEEECRNTANGIS